MNIPVFEKLSSFFLFIGLGIIFYTLNFIIRSGENVEQKSYAGKLDTLHLKYKQKLDSAECVVLLNKIKELEKLNNNDSNEEIRKIDLIVKKKLILNEERNEEIKIIHENIVAISKQDKTDSTIGALVGLIIGVCYAIIGILFLCKEKEDSKKCDLYERPITRIKLKDYLKNKRTYKKIQK